MGWEDKNDMRDQADHGLRVCNEKIRKYLLGLPGQICQNFWEAMCGINQLELFFFKNGEIEWKGISSLLISEANS